MKPETKGRVIRVAGMLASVGVATGLVVASAGVGAVVAPVAAEATVAFFDMMAEWAEGSVKEMNVLAALMDTVTDEMASTAVLFQLGDGDVEGKVLRKRSVEELAEILGIASDALQALVDALEECCMWLKESEAISAEKKDKEKKKKAKELTAKGEGLAEKLKKAVQTAKSSSPDSRPVLTGLRAIPREWMHTHAVDTVKERCVKAMGVDTRSPRIVVLAASSGMGKTVAVQLAARDFSEQPLLTRPFDVVGFLDARSKESIYNSLALMAPTLGVKKVHEVKQTAQAVLDALGNSKRKWLLIYDNANSADVVVFDHVPAGGGGTVLVTTTRTDASEVCGTRPHFALGDDDLRLSDAEARKLAGRVQLHYDGATVAQCGGVPMLVALVAKNPDLGAAWNTLLGSALAKVADQDGARKVLDVLSTLHSRACASVPQEVLLEVCAGATLTSLHENQLVVQQEENGIIYFGMHDRAQTWHNSTASADEVTNALVAVWPDNFNQSMSTRGHRLQVGLDPCARAMVESNDTTSKRTELAVCSALAKIHVLSRPGDALALCDAELDKCLIPSSGVPAGAVSATQIDLAIARGQALLLLGRRADSLKQHEHVLAMDVAAGVQLHNLHLHLAMTLRKKISETVPGEYEPAEKYFRKVIDAADFRASETHHVRLRALFNLGLAKEKTKDFSEAHRLIQQALDGWSAQHAGDETAPILSEARAVLSKVIAQDPGASADQIAKSVATMEASHAYEKRVNGPMHRNTLQSEESLARLYHMQGAYQEAYNKRAYNMAIGAFRGFYTTLPDTNEAAAVATLVEECARAAAVPLDDDIMARICEVRELTQAREEKKKRAAAKKAAAQARLLWLVSIAALLLAVLVAFLK